MSISSLLSPNNVFCKTDCPSRKRALQFAAQSIAENDPDQDGLVADEVFDGLLERERLGSTGLGFGIAIPHCRMACQSIHATFVSLATPIDYEAADHQEVDLLFVLVVPQNETHTHLELLAELAGLFELAENRAALRQCQDAQSLLECFQGFEKQHSDVKRA